MKRLFLNGPTASMPKTGLVCELASLLHSSYAQHPVRPYRYIVGADGSGYQIEYPSLPPADQVKSAEQFVEMVSKPQFLGNHLIKTQHFIGVGRWQKLSQDEIIGTRQVRIAHQRYKDDSFKEVLVKGHDHGTATFRFRRIEGVWRFAGLKPNNRWSEFERDKVFADSL